MSAKAVAAGKQGSVSLRANHLPSILVLGIVCELLIGFLLSFKGDLYIEDDIQPEKYAPKARSAN